MLGGISLWFWFLFSWWSVIFSIFLVLVGHFFGEMSTQVFCPLWTGLFYSCWVLEVLYLLSISDTQFASIFSCSEVSSLLCLWWQNYKIFMNSNLFFFCCMFCCCSVDKLCWTLQSHGLWGTPGFPVLHYLPEFAQTHVPWICDAIQPSHSLLPPSSPALNLSQHQGLF